MSRKTLRTLAVALAVLVAGSAIAGNVEVRLPVAFDVPDPCDPNSLLHFTGDEVWSGTIAAEAGGFQLKLSGNLGGVEASTDSGRKYAGQGAFTLDAGIKAGSEATLVVSVPMAPGGDGKPFTLNLSRHVTVASESELTSSIFNFFTECSAGSAGAECGEGLDCK